MTEPCGDYIDRLPRRLEEVERNAERWHDSGDHASCAGTKV